MKGRLISSYVKWYCMCLFLIILSCRLNAQSNELYLECDQIISNKLLNAQTDINSSFKVDKSKSSQYQFIIAQFKQIRFWILFISIIATILYFDLRSRFRLSYSEKLYSAIESNQKKIAQDIHDNIGQKIMLLKRKASETGHTELISLAQNSLNEIRALSLDLHGSSILEYGITRAIIKLINYIDEQTSIIIDHHIENVDKSISKKHQIHLYRVIQESLSNIIKHSQSTEASISLRKQQKRHILLIRDNGIGFQFFDHKSTINMGINSIKDRCKYMGASIQFSSNPLEGSSLLIIL